MAQGNWATGGGDTIATTNGNSTLVALDQLLSGELQQFNRLAGGAIMKYASVAADTAVVSGPAILYGLVLIAAGTMANIYDNTAASGTVVIPSTTASVTLPGGVLMNNGIYADWTSGTWLVLYAEAV